MKSARHLSLGRWGEDQAEKYLRGKGYRVLERNFRGRTGEIDLIAEDGKCLVFVEVKTRTNLICGHPLEGIDARKQGQLTRAAGEYLALKGAEERNCRFDAVSVINGSDGPVIELVKNAFDMTG